MLLGDMMRIHSAKFSLSSSKYMTFALGSFGILMAEVFAYRMGGGKRAQGALCDVNSVICLLVCRGAKFCFKETIMFA